MSEWQPIESAPTWQPKEGANIFLGLPEVILGWDSSGRIAMGYWVPDRKDSGEWRAVGHAVMEPPTHWMPLPAPPGVETGIPVIRMKDGLG